MHDGHHVLHHLLFRGQAFLIQYKQLAAMLARHMFTPLVAEAHQTIPVRQHQDAYLATPDAIAQFEETTPLEVQPAADLFDKFDIGQTAGDAEFFQPPALVAQIRLLRRARYPAVGMIRTGAGCVCTPIRCAICASLYRRKPVGLRASGENVPQRSHRCSVLGVTPSLLAAAPVFSIVSMVSIRTHSRRV